MSATEKHIRHFNLMNGNLIGKKKLQKFYDAVEKDIKTGNKSVELKTICDKLRKALSQVNGHVVEVRLKPLKINANTTQETKVVEAPKSKPENKKSLPPVKGKEPGKAGAEHSKKIKQLDGVVDAAALSGIKFKKLALAGQYKKDFHQINSDTQIMVWGSPGHGKTVYLLRFAQYLSKDLGVKTLFVANEEFNRSTFAEKLNTFHIGNPNLKFSKNFTDEMLESFDAVFFDSINSTGITLDQYRDMKNKHPNKLIVLIVQSTKDGDFRGGKDWEHEVDVAGEIFDRKMVMRKNRLDPENNKKANKMRVDEKVNQKIEIKRINELVKNKIKPEPAEPVSA